MDTLKIFKEYNNKKLSDYPEINYSSLYQKVLDTFHFEFEVDKDHFLFSPYYTLLKGDRDSEWVEFVNNNEVFLDSLKEFVLNSLYVYSALIEENSYYLSNTQSIFIARIIHKKDVRFEIKFYTHYQDELLDSYKDKIYIGRDFLNLKKFPRKYLGLKKFFRSLVEQNEKIQERAVHKLRYIEDYRKPFLDEINYLTEETFSDAMERIKLFPEQKIADIPNGKLGETLDNVLFLLNLMIELVDITQEFENKLRLREETGYVKYLTKFLKDLIDGIRFLRKMSSHLHLRISGFAIDRKVVADTKCV
ncbi:MAG: hypothetical protein GY765_41100 [bacterium]|nr:hypothetical protein [bacterium]